MGGFCTPSYTELPSATQTVEGTEIPEWVAAAGREIFSTATDIAGSDYPIYTGERSATYDGSRLTEDERRGMEILRSGAENYLPYMNRASAIANTLGQGYDAASRAELMGSPYSGASRDYLEGDFQGLSADELLGQYQGATRDQLLGQYQGASREDLLGEYQGATREELLGQGVDPFSMENAQEYMDIYQQSMDPAIREIEEQTIRAQNQARQAAGRAPGGAFGSRLGILEGTAAGEGATAAGDLRARAAREGLGFAAGRYDQDVAQAERDRQARFGAEDVMRGQFMEDRQARFGAEDVMRGQFMEDQAARFGAEDVMRGQFMEDRQGRFSAEDIRRQQAESDRAARFGAEDVMYGRYGDERAARFGAEDARRQGFETDEAARIAQMNAYQNMGTLVTDLQNQAAAGLISSGEAQRVLDQRALDMAYADFLDQRMYPQEMVNFALGALSGTPYSTRNRSYQLGSSFTQNPSVYGQLISGLGAGYSAYRMANDQ
mgnify:CR=1 FL=1|tara:strand:- start:76 stop:1554 length:1479 start_codon:yes stop_codon:yes gene_type:complete